MHTNSSDTELEQKLWSPKVLDNIDSNQFSEYLELSCTSCLPGGGRNVEYALHVLHQSHGDLIAATRKLLNPMPTIQDISNKTNNHTEAYLYVDTFGWSEQEIEAFERLVVENRKDFYRISQLLGTKSVKQCIEFYYFWKKATKLRFPTNSSNNTTNNSATNNKNLTNNIANNIDQSNSNSSDLKPNINDINNNINHSNSNNNHNLARDKENNHRDVFPCKVCGRVFEKIKSRSAHMKRHKNEARG